MRQIDLGGLIFNGIMKLGREVWSQKHRYYIQVWLRKHLDKYDVVIMRRFPYQDIMSCRRHVAFDMDENAAKLIVSKELRRRGN